ncbi:hypothetical protein [Micromonospora sp. NPDC050200]|uniref:hypothetical protein n=1 Tax=Micromonospora sp. NPDC050200 TaxID=3155664 RepID=UPI00340A5D02
MVNKHFPAQFKADAVVLHRSRPGATIAQIADDLGVNRETLHSSRRERGWTLRQTASRAGVGRSTIFRPGAVQARRTLSNQPTT